MHSTFNIMKILHIVVHSREITNLERGFDGEAYEKMYKSLSHLYAMQPNVRTIFVEFSNSIQNSFLLEGDRLILKGKESIIPGLMVKTLEALMICSAEEYDYVVRSNISSVINFQNLISYINLDQNKNINYLGGFVWLLNWIDPVNGIVDDKYFGTRYASGTLALFSKECIKKIIRYRHFIDYSICEDLAFGVFCTKFLGLETQQLPPQKSIMNQQLFDIELKKIKIKEINTEFSPILWRNKTESRLHDAECVDYICELLIK